MLHPARSAVSAPGRGPVAGPGRMSRLRQHPGGKISRGRGMRSGAVVAAQRGSRQGAGDS